MPSSKNVIVGVDEMGLLTLDFGTSVTAHHMPLVDAETLAKGILAAVEWARKHIPADTILRGEEEFLAGSGL